MAKISIIIPVYNMEQYLQKCLESVVKQDFEDYEVLLVDDGSTDRSSQILWEYQHADPDRVRCIHKENGGLSSALNLGLDNAKGEYVTLLDSDDTISPDFLSRLYQEAREHDCDVVVSGQYKVYEDGTIADTIRYQPDAQGNSVLRRLNMHGKIYRRNYIEKYHIRFPERKIYEDNPFNLMAFFLTDRIRFVPYEGYYQLVHEGSITSQKIQYDRLPIQALEHAVRTVRRERFPGKDRALFEFTAMSFFTYFLFVRNKKKEYLDTGDRSSDMKTVWKVCDDFRKIVKKYFKNYTGNPYAKILGKHELQLSQRAGVRVFAWLVKLNLLKPFIWVYYKL